MIIIKHSTKAAPSKYISLRAASRSVFTVTPFDGPVVDGGIPYGRLVQDFLHEQRPPLHRDHRLHVAPVGLFGIFCETRAPGCYLLGLKITHFFLHHHVIPGPAAAGQL